MKPILIMAVCSALAASAQAQTTPHSGSPAPTSQAGIIEQIAWFGAVCGGYGLGYNAHTQDAAGMTEVRAELAALAVETGATLADLTALAERRAVEFERLFEIVLPVHDTTGVAPEPFANILRLGQSDCQEVQRMRNLFTAAINSGRLPVDAPAGALRAALRPDPDVAYRATRVALVLQTMLDEMAAGAPISDDLLSTYAAFTGDAPLPEDMDPDMATRADMLAHWTVRGPVPVIEDITRDELVAVVQHILDTPGDPNRQHYFDLFIANTPYGARDLIVGPWAIGAPLPTAEAIVAEALRD